MGSVPEGWEVLPLARLLSCGPTNGYSGRTGEPHRGTPTLSLAATTGGRLVLSDETVKYLERRVPANSSLFLQPGDVLVQRSNTAELVGTTALFDGPSGTFVYPDLMMRLRFREPGMGEWFWRYANTGAGRAFFKRVAAGSTGTMPKISGAALRRMPIPLPGESHELAAITAVLSDADTLIESMEQLLAKKRDLRLGAAQGLLTGRQRLRRFVRTPRTQATDVGRIPTDWDVHAIEDVGVVVAGKALNARGPGAQRSYLRTKNVLDGKIDLEDVLRMPMTDQEFDRYRLKLDDVLLNEGQSLELVGRCSIYRGEFRGPCAIQNQLVRFRARDGVSAAFAAHLFRYCQRSGVFARIATQTTSVAHLGVSRFQRLRVAWPADLDEQRAIAEALTGMDDELDAMEAKLAKVRLIKQGMAQELLTGRTRLV